MFVPFELVGRSFGKYQVSEFIGRGPMAYVFRVFDPETQQTLALKLFPKTPSETPEAEFRETFFREIETARRLVHPQVSIILDAGETEDFHYLVAEFVPGRSLEEIIQEQGPLSLEEALPLFRQVLEALEAAHRKGLVHRNLKPSNILVTREGRVKLTDLAQAKIPSMAATMSFSGAGSPYYMSPEQLLGQRGDIRSDIFSVGALLYRVLTGEKPFDGESTATIVDQVVQAEAPSPKTINPHIPEALEKICTRAMAKDPDRRYPTPGEMLADLEAVGYPETAAGIPPVPVEGPGEVPAEDEGPAEGEKGSTEKLRVEQPAARDVPEGKSPEAAVLPDDPAEAVPEFHQPASASAEDSARPGRFGFKTLLAALVLVLVLITATVLMFGRTGKQVSPSTSSPPAPSAPGVVYNTPAPTQTPTLPATPAVPTPAPPPAPTQVRPRPYPPVQTEDLIRQAKAVWATDLDQARGLLERAVAQSPENFEAHFQLGRLLTQQKRYPAAIREYQQALNLNNRVPEVYFNLGYIHLIQGNYDLAIQHLEWCRALNPPYQDEVLTNIGIVYLRKKNAPQARLYLKEALKLNPRNELAQDYLKRMDSGKDREHKKKERHS